MSASVARTGSVECLCATVLQRKCVVDYSTCAAAAEKGSLECLRFLHEHEWTTRDAVCSGSLPGLAYAMEHGCPLLSFPCRGAVMHGHLDCLRYLHENGSELGDLDCRDALKFVGSVECLRYLHEQGCHSDANTCGRAAY